MRRPRFLCTGIHWMRLLACLFPGALMLPTGSVHAEDYPSRPITMVVPFAPGGIADITGRPLAASLAKILGQPLVIENRAGAGGAIGMAYAAHQPADGYTILMALSSIVIIPESDRVSGRKPSYQLSDFTPVALISADPTVLLVGSDSPWHSVAELIADAKAHPDRISYSSSGVYGTTHTALAMFAQAADISLLHVPYKGGGPAMTALLTGEVGITAQAPGVAEPYVKSGKARVLASWAGARTANLPSVPTLRELGVDAEFYIWAGVFLPAATPPQIVARLREASRKAATEDPDFQRAMAAMNAPIAYRDGADFDRFIERDAARLGRVVQRMGKLE
jgi:tripartite-type tricarboxylate transporter receptor subunit TctC